MRRWTIGDFICSASPPVSLVARRQKQASCGNLGTLESKPPRFVAREGRSGIGAPARPFRGLLSVYSRCGLHTRAVTKVVTAIRGLQTFRHLHACPGCFRLERSPGGACTRWKSAALSRRTWKPVIQAARGRGSFLRHAGLAQAGEICGLKQSLDLWHAPSLAGLQMRDAGKQSRIQPVGFG
jgi:hypothetical protein